MRERKSVSDRKNSVPFIFFRKVGFDLEFLSHDVVVVVVVVDVRRSVTHPTMPSPSRSSTTA